jgi:hypothetical protein
LQRKRPILSNVKVVDSDGSICAMALSPFASTIFQFAYHHRLHRLNALKVNRFTFRCRSAYCGSGSRRFRGLRRQKICTGKNQTCFAKIPSKGKLSHTSRPIREHILPSMGRMCRPLGKCYPNRELPRLSQTPRRCVQ